MSQEARAWAEQAVEDAIRAGEEGLLEAARNAAEESAEMLKKSEREAAKQAKDLASNTENKKAVMHARAEREMDRAVAFIIEWVFHRGQTEGGGADE